MPERKKIFSSYIKIMQKRGVKSVFEEFKENFLFDLIYNVETQLREGKSDNLNHHYSPIYSTALRDCLSSIDNKHEMHFVDYGCGKGKGLLIASQFNFKKITGIDINKNLLNICKRNIKNFRKNNYKPQKIKLINSDALKYKINDENVFFFFNPFSNIILDKVLKNILNYKKKKIYVIFAGPKLTNKILKKKFKLILKKSYNTYDCSLLEKL